MTKSRLTLCDSMDYSMPSFPVLHYLLEFAQTHVHWVGGAIQTSYPLLPSSPPALSLSQHQGIFQWVSYICVMNTQYTWIYVCVYVCSVTRSSLTLCDSMDYSTPDFSVRISQASVLEWLPFPPLGDLPDSGIEPASPVLAGEFFTTEPPGEPEYMHTCIHTPRTHATYIHTTHAHPRMYTHTHIYIYLIFIIIMAGGRRSSCPSLGEACKGGTTSSLSEFLKPLRLLYAWQFVLEFPSPASFSELLTFSVLNKKNSSHIVLLEDMNIYCILLIISTSIRLDLYFPLSYWLWPPASVDTVKLLSWQLAKLASHGQNPFSYIFFFN